MPTVWYGACIMDEEKTAEGELETACEPGETVKLKLPLGRLPEGSFMEAS